MGASAESTEQPFSRLIRMNEVRHLTGLAKSAVYNGMRAGTFPLSVKLGNKSVAWYESEVKAWVRDRPRYTPSPVEEDAA